MTTVEQVASALTCGPLIDARLGSESSIPVKCSQSIPENGNDESTIPFCTMIFVVVERTIGNSVTVSKTFRSCRPALL